MGTTAAARAHAPPQPDDAVDQFLRLVEEERARDRALRAQHEVMLAQQGCLLAACRRALGDAEFRRIAAAAAC